MDTGRKSSHWDLVGLTWPDLRSFLHAGCCCSTRSQRLDGTSPRRAPWTSQRTQRFQRLAWSSPTRALWWTLARCCPPTSLSPFPGRLTLTLTRSSAPSPPSLLVYPSLGLDVGWRIFMPNGNFSVSSFIWDSHHLLIIFDIFPRVDLTDFSFVLSEIHWFEWLNEEPIFKDSVWNAKFVNRDLSAFITSQTLEMCRMTKAWCSKGLDWELFQHSLCGI